jgi:hypothetical protein
MPEPSVAGQGQQAEAAATPQTTADEPRTDAGANRGSLMDFLDIPADVQGQLKPREAQSELPGDIPTSSSEEPESPPPTEEEVPSRDEEAADESEEEAEEEQPTQEQQPKIDKRQKRINRLTRQKSELQSKLDAAYAQAEEMRQQLEHIQGKQQQAAGITTPSVGRLGWIGSERQLIQEVSKANAVIEWCDQNPDGVTTGSGENEQYVEPETIAHWRREAEKVVLNAPIRREELREFSSAQNYYVGLVQENWPELLDQRSPEYQMAVAILQRYPFLAQTPQGIYAAGLAIEGAKSLDARNAAKANGQKQQHRDIDERAFGPRVPLSPHVANPPTRTATPSSKQRLNEAMSNLVKDTDGSATSVAAAFSAMDAARPQQRPTGKTPVRS